MPANIGEKRKTNKIKIKQTVPIVCCWNLYDDEIEF